MKLILRFFVCMLSMAAGLVNLEAQILPLLGEDELNALPKDGGQKYNRLIFEKSPYLLQHASNPVDWFPWSQEAFDKAKKENKPIFLSIGYSSCHWCHVMERESFADGSVARILNQNYISIKVDREVRPDVDSLYMLATQMILRGRGGWPNSLWLTPDLKPFYAGTYFPKEDTNGQMGFIKALNLANNLFVQQRDKVEESAEIVYSAMKELLSPDEMLPEDLTLQSRMEALRQVKYFFSQLLDPKIQGPKFPPHQKLLFLIQEARKSQNDILNNLIKDLLKKMAMGGMYDQIGGGFHRYSTDGQWMVPHFEKMLYDNAQLALIYAEAYELTKDPFLRQVCEETIDFVFQELTSNDGAFYSALDADSEGQEGTFYLWQSKDLIEVLGEKPGKELVSLFQLNGDTDSSSQLKNNQMESMIPHLKFPVLKTEALIGQIKVLREARSKRSKPLRDDKIIVSWNALMIKALTRSSQILSKPIYLNAAQKAVNTILSTMRTKKVLYHNSRLGKNGVPGYLEDYAFLANCLLDLFELDQQENWLREAQKLVREAEQLFHDKKSGAYFRSSLEHDKLFIREIDKADSVIPSGSAVLADTLFRLYKFTKDKAFLKDAHQLLRIYHSELMHSPMQTVSFMGTLLSVYETFNSAAKHPMADKKMDPEIFIENFPLKIKAQKEPTKRSILLQIDISKGWHINSSAPHQEYLIPTKVELPEGANYNLGEIKYPKGVDLEFDFSDEPVSVYEGVIQLVIPYTDSHKNTSINLVLNSQACSDSECRRPEKINIAVPVTP